MPLPLRGLFNKELVNVPVELLYARKELLKKIMANAANRKSQMHIDSTGARMATTPEAFNFGQQVFSDLHKKAAVLPGIWDAENVINNIGPGKQAGLENLGTNVMGAIRGAPKMIERGLNRYGDLLSGHTLGKLEPKYNVARTVANNMNDAVLGKPAGHYGELGHNINTNAWKNLEQVERPVFNEAMKVVGTRAATGTAALGGAAMGADHLMGNNTKTSASSPAWQRSAGKNEEGGLNAKGRASYNKATGGNLKAPVTESNPKGDRAKRQNSFCSRMCGMKKHETGSKTKKDPDSRINKSLRKWNCKCSNAQMFGANIGAAQNEQNGFNMPNTQDMQMTGMTYDPNNDNVKALQAQHPDNWEQMMAQSQQPATDKIASIFSPSHVRPGEEAYTPSLTRFFDPKTDLQLIKGKSTQVLGPRILSQIKDMQKPSLISAHPKMLAENATPGRYDPSPLGERSMTALGGAGIGLGTLAGLTAGGAALGTNVGRRWAVQRGVSGLREAFKSLTPMAKLPAGEQLRHATGNLISDAARAGNSDAVNKFFQGFRKMGPNTHQNLAGVGGLVGGGLGLAASVPAAATAQQRFYDQRNPVLVKQNAAAITFGSKVKQAAAKMPSIPAPFQLPSAIFRALSATGLFGKTMRNMDQSARLVQRGMATGKLPDDAHKMLRFPTAGRVDTGPRLTSLPGDAAASDQMVQNIKSLLAQNSLNKQAFMVGGTLGALGGLATSKPGRRGEAVGRGGLIGAGTELGMYPGALLGGLSGLALGGLAGPKYMGSAGALGTGIGALGGGLLGNIGTRGLLDSGKKPPVKDKEKTDDKPESAKDSDKNDEEDVKKEAALVLEQLQKNRK